VTKGGLFSTPRIVAPSYGFTESSVVTVKNGAFRLKVELQCGDRAITPCLIWENGFHFQELYNAREDSAWERPGKKGTTLNVQLRAQHDTISLHRYEVEGIGRYYLMILTSEWRGGLMVQCFFTIGALRDEEDGTYTTLTAPDVLHTRHQSAGAERAVAALSPTENFMERFSAQVWEDRENKEFTKSIGSGPKGFFIHFNALDGYSKQLTRDGVEYIKSLLGKMRVKYSNNLQQQMGEFKTKYLFGQPTTRNMHNCRSSASSIYAFNKTPSIKNSSILLSMVPQLQVRQEGDLIDCEID